jgi:hypothetical protein
MTKETTEAAEVVSAEPAETQDAENALAGEAANQDAEAPEAAEQSAEAEATEEAANDNAEGEGETEEQVQAKPDAGKHKRAGGFNRKIERLERANQEKDAVIAQLSRQLGVTPEGPQPTTKAMTPEEKAAADFQALVDQRVKRQLAEERAASEQQRLLAEIAQKEQAFRATHDDYDDALDAFTRAGIPADHVQAVLTSSDAPAIMYSLASNPAELARFRALPPLAAAREIGRLEAKLASGAAPQKPKATVRPPAPPTSVGGSKASTRSPEELPLSEYKRLMNGQKGR